MRSVVCATTAVEEQRRVDAGNKTKVKQLQDAAHTPGERGAAAGEGGEEGDQSDPDDGTGLPGTG